MSDWLVTMGFLSATGGWGSYELSPPQVTGDFDRPPVLQWSVSLLGPSESAHTEPAEPVLFGDKIYLGSSTVDGLLVLDRRSGRLLSTLPANGPVASAPVFANERIYFADTAGTTWCYAQNTLQLVWEHFSGAPVLAAPTVNESQVFISNVDNLVFALSAEDGSLLWRHAHKADSSRLAELELYGAPSPLISGGEVLAGFSDGTLLALDPVEGNAIWQRRVGEGQYPDLISSPIIHDDAIVISGYSEPLLSMTEDLSVRWRLDVGGAHSAVGVGTALLHGGGDGILRSVDSQTGVVRWSWDSGTASALTRPVLTEAGVLVGASSGSVYLVDLDSGDLVWSYSPDYFLSGVTATPAVDGRQVVVLTNAGNLLGFVVPPASVD